jgi:hypothetical protein
MVVPYERRDERRGTPKSAHKAASHPGFVPQAQLRRCRPCEQALLFAAARALDLRPVATETRLMGNIGAGSSETSSLISRAHGCARPPTTPRAR